MSRVFNATTVTTMTTAVQKEPDLILPSDAARRARVSVGAIRNWIRQGRLPALTLSGGVRAIRPADLERFIAERRQGTDEE